MSQDYLIKVACIACQKVNYQSTKNKKTIKARLELNKYCPHCKSHQAHKETK